MDLEKERKKALSFLAGRGNISLDVGRSTVRPAKEELEVIGSQERKNELKEIKNPRLRTEAYLKQIGKL